MIRLLPVIFEYSIQISQYNLCIVFLAVNCSKKVGAGVYSSFPLYLMQSFKFPLAKVSTLHHKLNGFFFNSSNASIVK